MHVENRKCVFSALHDMVVDMQVPVPDKCIDSLFPEVRRILECVKARNARLRSANPQAEDRVSDRAAEGLLQTVLYAGICFWQNLPFRTERYVQHNRTYLRTWTKRQMIRMSAMSSLTCRYVPHLTQTASCSQHHDHSRVFALCKASLVPPQQGKQASRARCFCRHGRHTARHAGLSEAVVWRRSCW